MIIAITILLGDASSVLDHVVSNEDLGYTTGPEVRYEDRVYDEGRHFGYSRGTFCCIPERDSFHMIGRPYSQKSAELSNPGPGQRSKIVTDFFDPTLGAHAEQERETALQLQAMLYDRGRIYLCLAKSGTASKGLSFVHTVRL